MTSDIKQNKTITDNHTHHTIIVSHVSGTGMRLLHSYKWFVALASTFPVVLSLAVAKESEPPEALFRRTVEEWRSRGSYDPWQGFTKTILHRFHTDGSGVEAATAANNSGVRLELIGAVEESILVIEKSTLHHGEDQSRDTALSLLYSAYGETLAELDPEECLAMAMDPHTLLIGADKVQAESSAGNSGSPSVDLCVENAENSLRNAVTLDATNNRATELLAKILGSEGDVDKVHQRKPKEFVAELFDSFADTFDQKLLGDLGYQVPKLVGEAVQAVRTEYENALDAGVGTGLAGRFLRPLVSGNLIGVDASQKMLNIAANCTTSLGCGISTLSTIGSDDNKESTQNSGRDANMPLYDRLLNMDLEDMTLGNTLNDVSSQGADASSFDLIVAADVLVYFGSLENLIRTFASLSSASKKTVLVFSCERAAVSEAPLGWRLLPSGRFAHTKEHAVNVATQAGYKLMAYQEIVPRMEKGEKVRGHLFTFVFNNEPDDDGQSEL